MHCLLRIQQLMQILGNIRANTPPEFFGAACIGREPLRVRRQTGRGRHDRDVNPSASRFLRCLQFDCVICPQRCRCGARAGRHVDGNVVAQPGPFPLAGACEQFVANGLKQSCPVGRLLTRIHWHQQCRALRQGDDIRLRRTSMCRDPHADREPGNHGDGDMNGRSRQRLSGCGRAMVAIVEVDGCASAG